MCNPPVADGRANITQRKGISVMANVLFLYICDSFFYLTEKCQRRSLFMFDVTQFRKLLW